MGTRNSGEIRYPKSFTALANSDAVVALARRSVPGGEAYDRWTSESGLVPIMINLLGYTVASDDFSIVIGASAHRNVASTQENA
jgi:hypothetical protein